MGDALTQRLFDVVPYELPEPEPNGSNGMKDDSLPGQAAVLLCAARLMQRGYDVDFPAVDNRGVDLKVHGLGVQVKSTRTACSERGRQFWRFSAGGAERRTFGMIASRVAAVAFYAHDADAFWLVPSTALRASASRAVRFYGDSDWREAWDVFDVLLAYEEEGQPPLVRARHPRRGSVSAKNIPEKK